MRIEVGKAYRTRDGGVARITGYRDGFNYPFIGLVDGITYSWTMRGHSADAIHPRPFDLISLWEDSKTESKMDKGFRAFFKDRTGYEITEPRANSRHDHHLLAVLEAVGDYVDHKLSAAIKSVEPAPPGVGDTVTWGENGSGDRLIEGFGPGWVITRSVNPNSSLCNKLFLWEMPLGEFASKSGFRIIKRAEAK